MLPEFEGCFSHMCSVNAAGKPIYFGTFHWRKNSTDIACSIPFLNIVIDIRRDNKISQTAS
jgi:hypothetical protein